MSERISGEKGKEKTKRYIASISIIFALSLSAVSCSGLDFLYLVLQWPGSYCSTKQGCCYPNTGKPIKDFTIAGLWTSTFAGSIPQFCDSNSHFNAPKNSNLTKSLRRNWPSFGCPGSDGYELRSQQWQKYGTCSCLNPQKYLETAIRLRKKVNVLKLLSNAGIQPNGTFYDKQSAVEDAILKRLGVLAGFWCNKDKSGNSQLYQVVLCSDGTRIIECPGMPMIGECSPKIKFPPLKGY